MNKNWFRLYRIKFVYKNYFNLFFKKLIEISFYIKAKMIQQ